MKKFISLVLCIAAILSLAIPAYADYEEPELSTVEDDGEPIISDSSTTSIAQPTFIRTTTSYISSCAGIAITVVYTFNDSNGCITGMQSATITGYPTNVTSPRIVNSTVSDDYILLSITYWESGVCKPDYAYCYGPNSQT